MHENKNNDKNSFFACSAKAAAQFSGIVLFITFFVFCFGYSVGYRRAIQESLRGIQKESLAQEVYANAFFVNNQNQSEVTNINQGEELFYQEEQGLAEDLFTARLIGYPETHKRNALQFVEKWKKRGISLLIKEHGSNNSKNKQWVQVLIEPNKDKIQIEFLANIISKEEKLTDVIVELYSSEEKTI